MTDLIHLTNSNFQQYLPINIVAFSYAYSGAQGEPGGVYIIDDNGKIFHFNYIEDKLKKNDRNRIQLFVQIHNNRKHR